MKDGDAAYDYNWSWYSQYGSGTYGLRVDFTNSAYYFTGNSSTLAPTGAYINVTVVGTTDFQTTSLPRLYRNTNTTIQAKLVDNSLNLSAMRRSTTRGRSTGERASTSPTTTVSSKFRSTFRPPTLWATSRCSSSTPGHRC